MTDGLRKSHLRKAPQVGLSEVGLPEGNRKPNAKIVLHLTSHQSAALVNFGVEQERRGRWVRFH